MAHDVFISYSAKDEPTAKAMCATLERRNIRCWMASRDILASADWRASITEAIEQSRVFVLVFSADSNQSDHVKREVQNAVDAGIPILPFRIHDVRPSPAMRYILAALHYLDAFTPPLEQHLQHLADTVQALLGRAGGEETAQTAAEPVPIAKEEAEAAERPPAPSGGETALRQLAEIAWLDGSLTQQERAFLLARAKEMGIPAERAERIVAEARPQQVHVPQAAAAPVPVQPSPHREGEAGACLRTFEGHKVVSVSLPADGRRALSGGRDGTLRLWDVEMGQCLSVLRGHTDAVFSVCLSPDGRRALSGGRDKTLKLWDVATGRCLRTFEGHTDAVLSVCLSLDERRALSAGRDGTLRLWDVEMGQCLSVVRGHTDAVFSVCLSPDGRRLVSGSLDKTLKLWDVATGECLRTFAGHNEGVKSVCLSPDGRSALSGSYDKTLKLWDVATGQCLRTLVGHTHSVQAVAVSADSRWAVSGSDDKTLKLWDLATGLCLRTFEGHMAAVCSVCLSSDGRWALSGSDDKTLKLWEMPPKVWMVGHTGAAEGAKQVVAEARPQEALDSVAGTRVPAAPPMSAPGEKAAAAVSPAKPVAQAAAKPKETPLSTAPATPAATVAASKGTAAAPPAPSVQAPSGAPVSDATLRLQLKDKDYKVRKGAIEEVGRRGLSDFAEDLKDVLWTDQNFRSEALQTLRQLGVVISAEEIAERLHADPEESRLAALYLIQVNRVPDLVDRVKDVARSDESPGVRAFAMGVLNHFGIDAPLGELHERLKDPNGGIRGQAVIEIGRRDLREFTDQLKAMAWTDESAGVHARTLLARWGIEASPEELRTYLRSPSHAIIIGAIYEIVRRDLQEFRAELAEIALSKASYGFVAVEALQKWSAWGPALEGLLRDKSRSWAARRQAVEQMVTAGRGGDHAALGAVARDAEDNPEVRVAAIKALNQLRVETAADDLRQRLKDADARIREWAIREIGKRELREFAGPLRALAGSDPDAGLRELAGGLLSQWGVSA